MMYTKLSKAENRVPLDVREVKETITPHKGTEIYQDRWAEVANFAENNMNFKKSYARHMESFAQNVERRITSVPFVEPILKI